MSLRLPIAHGPLSMNPANQTRAHGVLCVSAYVSSEYPLAAVLVSAGADIDREFEARLADSSALAFRVAYSVLSMSNTLRMRDGQTQQFSLASDKITREILRVDVTATVVK